VNRWLSLLTAVWALTLGACSSFDRDWRAAAQRPARGADPVAGAWDGEWRSEMHRRKDGSLGGGRLRCIFTKADATHYRARFHANWLCFATGYTEIFETRRRAGGLDFRGKRDLGAIFGGVYRYEGRVTPERFVGRFSSGFDRGELDMRRPAAPRAPSSGPLR